MLLTRWRDASKIRKSDTAGTEYPNPLLSGVMYELFVITVNNILNTNKNTYVTHIHMFLRKDKLYVILFGCVEFFTLKSFKGPIAFTLVFHKITHPEIQLWDGDIGKKNSISLRCVITIYPEAILIFSCGPALYIWQLRLDLLVTPILSTYRDRDTASR